MSHFGVLVIVGDRKPVSREEAQEAVTPLLAPYDENGEWFRPAGNGQPESKWDWWVIGGRMTGSLSGYDPEKDPANIQVCDVCRGTGIRKPMRADEVGITDAEMKEKFAWCGGCNGCGGTGKHVMWPTSWKEHDGDIARVADIPEDFQPDAVVLPDGQWLDSGSMGWFGVKREDTMSENAWADSWKRIRQEYRDAFSVIVDCHV